MTSGAIAAMLSTILYGRRFFPYYVYNIIGGLDEQGKCCVHFFLCLKCMIIPALKHNPQRICSIISGQRSRYDLPVFVSSNKVTFSINSKV